MNYITEPKFVQGKSFPIAGIAISVAGGLAFTVPQYPHFDYAQLKPVLFGETVRNSPVVTSRESVLEKEFQALAEQWRKEIMGQSSLGEIFTNDAYQRIMAMGRDALPMILADLKKRPGHWFYALEKIAGRDMAAGETSFANARAAWLEWGYKNNFI